jgi:hypothetical protein
MAEGASIERHLVLMDILHGTGTASPAAAAVPSRVAATASHLALLPKQLPHSLGVAADSVEHVPYACPQLGHSACSFLKPAQAAK